MLNRLAHGNPDNGAKHTSHCPQHGPEPTWEATPTEVEGVTLLLPIARELETTLYETIRKLKDCQLITEGDVSRQAEEWHRNACQGQELHESVLSWQA